MMARLRNRIRKADYFSDGELLRWHRDKRTTYSGLYALAEDSGCLEDDCFTWKLLLWPSPLDSDITVDRLEVWRDELVTAGKLVPYEARGQRYLFIRSFHIHEHPRNPQPNTLPLPPWVRWAKHDADARKGRYEVDEAAIPRHPDASTAPVQALYKDATTPPAQPSPALPRSLNPLADASAPADADDDDSASGSASIARDFEHWWTTYGRVGSKADALVLYRHWRRHEATADDLLAAATAYRDHCAATDCKMQHARTFLAKTPCRWREWADGEGHGAMDVRAERNLSDVLDAGARVFGLIGDDHDQDNSTGLIDVRPSRTALGRAHARCGLPAGELASGE